MDKAAFADYVDAFNRDDAAGYAKYYADDVTISYRGGELTLRGAQAIIDRYKAVHARVRQHLEVQFLVVNETGAAAELHATFTALEDWEDFEVHPLKKGERVRIHTFVHYDLNADGQIAAIRSVRHRTLETPSS